jgi:hypothetical protein
MLRFNSFHAKVDCEAARESSCPTRLTGRRSRGAQTSGYIAKLRLRWHPDLDVIRTVAEFINFEVQYVGHQCGSSRADWTDANLFYWQISFPFLSVLLCSAWWLLRAGLRYLQHTRRFRALFGVRDEVEVKTVRVVKNKSALASMSHTSTNLVDYVWIKFLMFFVTWYATGPHTVTSTLTERFFPRHLLETSHCATAPWLL